MALRGIWQNRARAEAAVARVARVAVAMEDMLRRALGHQDACAYHVGARKVALKKAHADSMYAAVYTAASAAESEAKILGDTLWAWLQSCATCGKDHEKDFRVDGHTHECKTHVYTLQKLPGYETYGPTATCRRCGLLQRDREVAYMFFKRHFIDEEDVTLCIRDKLTPTSFASESWSGIDMAIEVEPPPHTLIVSPDAYTELERAYAIKDTVRREVRRHHEEASETRWCAGCHHTELQHQKKGCTHHGCGCSKFRGTAHVTKARHKTRKKRKRLRKR